MILIEMDNDNFIKRVVVEQENTLIIWLYMWRKKNEYLFRSTKTFKRIKQCGRYL